MRKIGWGAGEYPVYEGFNEISNDDWLAEGKRKFGELKNWKFVCPNCGHVQSIEDFIKLKDMGYKVEPNSCAFQECIGRYDPGLGKCGTMNNQEQPCDYVSYGFSCLCDTVMVLKDGKKFPIFEFAPEQKE